MAYDQPDHGGPNYQGTIEPNAAYNIARAYAPAMSADELIRARIWRLTIEAQELVADLANAKHEISANQSNEENVRIIESEFACIRRALERIAPKVQS